MRKLKNSELGRLNVEDFKKTDKIPLIVILDHIEITEFQLLVKIDLNDNYLPN